MRIMRRVGSLAAYGLLMAMLYGCSGPSTEGKGDTSPKEAFVPDTLTAAEREAGVLTPQVLWKLGRLGSCELSPDSATVLYTVTRYSLAQNRSETSIYSRPTQGGDESLVVRNAFSPIWMSGDRVAFLRVVDGAAQLFTISPKGEGEQQVSSIEGGIESYWLSPDRSKLLYSQKVQVEPKTTDKYPGLDKANVRIIDSLMYRHWDYWVEGQYSHLFLVDYAEKIEKGGEDLMKDERWDAPMAPYFDPAEVVWAPDSRSIFYTCKKMTGRQYALSTNSAIYQYDLEKRTHKNLTPDNPGYDRFPSVSPDGRFLAWQQMRIPGYEADRARLMLLDLRGSEVRELMANYDQNADSYGWLANGNMYVISGVKATEQLFTLDVASGTLTQVTTGAHDIKWAAPVPSGWLVKQERLNHPPELYRLLDGHMDPLTTINESIFAVIGTSEIREEWIPTTNGEKMLTWLVLPPNFDSTKVYPAILYCQGGPQSTVSQFWSYRWNIQLMASQGYVVVAPNRHGVPSFGQAWNAQISGDYSGQNIRDYLSAIDYAAKLPWVDENRLGCVGASYGGYSAYYLAGVHEGRFKAFIAHNGMFNMESFYAATEETFFPNYDLGGAYWDKASTVAQRSYAASPHRLVDKWKTPILIIVGERDFRIPYTEGLQAFNAAQLRGVPSRLLVYPNETHFVSSPQNSIIWQTEFFEWLARWVKDPE